MAKIWIAVLLLLVCSEVTQFCRAAQLIDARRSSDDEWEDLPDKTPVAEPHGSPGADSSGYGSDESGSPGSDSAEAEPSGGMPKLERQPGKPGGNPMNEKDLLALLQALANGQENPEKDSSGEAKSEDGDSDGPAKDAPVCYECTSSSDPWCDIRPKRVDSFCDIKDENLCYTVATENITIRGCYDDLPEFLRDVCKDSEICKICDGPQCNTELFAPECYTCNGRKSPECADGDLSDEFLKVCGQSNAHCVAGVDARGYTHRGCLNDIRQPLEMIFPKASDTFYGNRANNKKFPENRISCYQCPFGAPECANVTEFLEPSACRLYSHFDQCFTVMDMQGQMGQGCLSDSSDERIACQAGFGLCAACNKHGCNDAPLMSEPQLECVHCSGGKDCSYGQDPETATPCQTPVHFGQKETCYIRTREDGTTDRGCTLDVENDFPEWCELDHYCDECDESGCNIINEKVGSCIRCDVGDEDCADPKDIYEYSEFCFLTDMRPYAYNDSGCYTFKTRQEEVVRGCVKDLGDEELEFCKSSPRCQICMGPDCNTNGANTFTAQLASVVLALLLASNIAQLAN